MFKKFNKITLFILLSALVFKSAPAASYEVTDKLSVGGILAGAYQYQVLGDSSPVYDNTGRGAVPFQVEISYTPTPSNELFAKFGFAAGNGLNGGTSPFYLVPWAASLEDDVKDINGRSRDYLLTAWYKHIFTFAGNQQLALTGGIIDATDYLDENTYSNDEYSQFMNEALVNGPQGFLPSFDIGGAAEWEFNQFAIKGVAMNVGENDDGNNYNYYGVQFSYSMKSTLGEGKYRAIFNITSEDFLNPTGTETESLNAFLLSFDQELGDIFGIWIRFGWANDDAARDWQSLYSGGLNINGSGWQRPDDNIGIGYAYLDGGNMGIDNSKVFETYYRFVFNEFFAATADIQYMKDSMNGNGGTDGWIFGGRLTAEF
jgi:porin